MCTAWLIIVDYQGLRRVSEGTRTPDRLDHNQELYQLSYAHRGIVESTSEPLYWPRPGGGLAISVAAANAGITALRACYARRRINTNPVCDAEISRREPDPRPDHRPDRGRPGHRRLRRRRAHGAAGTGTSGQLTGHSGLNRLGFVVCMRAHGVPDRTCPIRPPMGCRRPATRR